MPGRWSAAGFAVVLLAACDASPEAPPAPALGSAASEVINGQTTSDFPAVGNLLARYPDGGDWPACTATLIGCRTVVTAAHCFCLWPETGPDCAQDGLPRELYLPHGGLYQVESVALHPGYVWDGSTLIHDLAVLTLAEPAWGIEPMPLQETELATGADAVFLGYGRTIPDGGDYGIKRTGEPTIGACPPEDRDDLQLCWKGPSILCYGDSGGPLLADDGGGWQLAGVNSWHHWTEEEGTCGGWSVDAKIAAHLDWLRTVAGADLGVACDAAGRVGDALVESHEGALPSVGDQHVIEIEVPPGSSEVRVTANASLDPSDANIDVFLRRGAVPDTITNEFDCGDRVGRYSSACSVESPASGTYHAMVEARGPVALYQMTVTVLPGAPIAEPDAYELVDAIEVDAAGGVLANDSAGTSPTIRAELVRAPEHGELQLADDGSFTYVAAEGFVGSQSFRYQVTDGRFHSDEVEVELVVKAPADEGGCQLGGRQSGGAGILLLGLALAAVRRSRV